MNDHKDSTPAEIHFVDEAWDLALKLFRKGRGGARRPMASHKVEDFGLSPADAVAKGLADPLAAYSPLERVAFRDRVDPRWLQGVFFDRYGYLSPLEVVAREGAVLAEGGPLGLSRAVGEEPFGSVPEKLGLSACLGGAPAVRAIGRPRKGHTSVAAREWWLHSGSDFGAAPIVVIDRTDRDFEGFTRASVSDWYRSADLADAREAVDRAHASLNLGAEDGSSTMMRP